MAVTTIDAIRTGHPPLRKPQSDAAAMMKQLDGFSDPLRNRLPMVYERSAIDYRHTCIPDWGATSPDQFEFFPQNWALEPAPSTGERNDWYRKAVIPMAEDVGRRAIEASDSAPRDITHVIAVSCTGFFAPGLDIELVKRLNLRPSTQRTFIGFMGCYAAFNALRTAHAFCQSDPNARVLIVCAELCTLHFQIEDSLESVVVNSLFSDGAAGVVMSARDESDAAGRLAYIDNACRLDDDSMGDMTWDIGDTGFQMGLSSRVPKVIAKHLPDYVDDLLGRHDLSADEIDFWAIHPGGRAIVEKAQSVLGLEDADVEDSLEVLRQHGNMSSPTILFVLKRILEQRQQQIAGDGAPPSNDHGVAMAFGPGLTIEGALFKWC
ncbi:chalcone synthase [Longibacter salinarum]|uniref:Chalcone synthase n=1 Tax=Longibacter salinarum TaxID=1850348 RepID=A0A2A8D1Z4_9BACT|nr:type III polyketide synthase [Longibacter salinarum]PEN14910.1 chalcone synthase [Longibacter salinarum]